MRLVNDSILVFIGRVLSDDPRLTARDGQISKKRQQTRFVVDSNARIPIDSAMFSEKGQTLIATLKDREPVRAWPHNVTHLKIREDGGKVDLLALFQCLADIPVSSVLVEGGSQLIGALFDQQLVDKVAAFIAPVIIGGEESPSAVGGRGALNMAKISKLSKVMSQNVGDDLLITGDVEY